MQILVTGASGQIGRALVPHLLSQGHTVVGLARSDASASVISSLGATAARGELGDVASLEAALDGCDALIHLAGGVRGKGTTTPDVLNRQGTDNLIAALSRHPVERAVLASSCAVYGDRSNLWIEEDFEPSPNTRYGESKVACERAALASDTPWVIARLAAVYGEGFGFSMVERMAQGKAWLPGEGRNHVPTVHIDDAVGALTLLLDAPAGTIVHVADRSQPTLRAFYDDVHAVAGGEPMRFWSTYVPSYVQTWGARNNERLQSRLGLKPRFTPDNLKLFTNSVRLRTQVLEDLGYTWKHEDHASGVRATWGP